MVTEETFVEKNDEFFTHEPYYVWVCDRCHKQATSIEIDNFQRITIITPSKDHERYILCSDCFGECERMFGQYKISDQ